MASHYIGVRWHWPYRNKRTQICTLSLGMTALWPYSNGAVQIRIGLELAELVRKLAQETERIARGAGGEESLKYCHFPGCHVLCPRNSAWPEVSSVCALFNRSHNFEEDVCDPHHAAGETSMSRCMELALLRLDLWSAFPAREPQTRKQLKWLQSDFPGLARKWLESDLKVAQMTLKWLKNDSSSHFWVTFESLSGQPRKVSHFGVTLIVTLIVLGFGAL